MVGSRSAIVLAGGDGTRLRPSVVRWFGSPTPKQYCTFVGTRSMLDHTLDRAVQWCDASRVICVVAAHHATLLDARAARRSDGRFVVQPTNRETAPGLLLGLSHVLHDSPDSTVAVLPADQFIYPEWRFLRDLRLAGDAVDALPDRLILLGVRLPDSEEDYGWIVPGDALARANGRSIYAVRAFLEKPVPEEARAAKRAGAVCSTFVMVARAETLWRLTTERLPELVGGFERLREALGTSREHAVLQAIYQEMPSRDFSSLVIERAIERMALLTLEGIVWSDWGRPERILETLSALDKPTEHLHLRRVGLRTGALTRDRAS